MYPPVFFATMIVKSSFAFTSLTKIQNMSSIIAVINRRRSEENIFSPDCYHVFVTLLIIKD